MPLRTLVHSRSCTAILSPRTFRACECGVAGACRRYANARCHDHAGPRLCGCSCSGGVLEQTFTSRHSDSIDRGKDKRNPRGNRSTWSRGATRTGPCGDGLGSRAKQGGVVARSCRKQRERSDLAAASRHGRYSATMWQSHGTFRMPFAIYLLDGT